ncbi:TraM recognition domain-containing protein [Gordonia amarae]|uniref:TraD/TraG TraM recognition site domain-containing protein n=2 Tax=Gordonia amarae TaxID=36821 RepID=G7GN45_9ACTN|nr:TraM recognition domain-containing protein [Gordonia amarae]MCS3877244.1 hypothetical protein [Gordonia amarae]QHN16004.1 TraM recognition domain-containing protein [Gordonia amarae]QHN20573.1 TraM recognition domain-containing protein [Gordonia amarae]QHN29424.1 TraM recognition domain-containing protein [Gordonia amarae]QHN38214.1 TraM recognition domain-containing protein [Gordonia amarae]
MSRLGRKQQTPAQPPRPVPPPDEPYAGLLIEDVPNDPHAVDERNAGRLAGQRAATGPHLLVTSVTGAGKSRSVLGVNVIGWGARPVVCVSSKGDLAELTIRQRAKVGPVYLMDLSGGEVRDSELQGVPVTRVQADPCALVHDDDSALQMAALLMEVGELGAGNGSGSGGDSATWQTLARRPFAALLQASGYYTHPERGLTWGGGARWAVDAVENSSTDEPADEAEREAKRKDLDSPSWDVAYKRNLIQGSWHAKSLLSAQRLDPRQRDSIGINMRNGMSSWAERAISDHDPKKVPPFRPEMLAEHPGATLYIVAPLGGPGAPAATATITSMVDFWRKRVGALPSLLMVIDELPNTAPLPRLANWVGEARGLGIRLCVAVQGTSQFEPRWGSAGLRILRDTFPAILMLPGAPEPELIERAAWSAGKTQRGSSSLDSTARASQSRETTAAAEEAELVPKRRGQARLIIAGTPGVKVRVPDMSDLKGM